MEVLVGKSSINRGCSIATFPESPVFAMALSNRRELSIAHFYRSDAATKQAQTWPAISGIPWPSDMKNRDWQKRMARGMVFSPCFPVKIY